MNSNKAYGGDININADALSATQRRKAEIEAQSKILKAQRDLEQVKSLAGRNVYLFDGDVVVLQIGL